MNRGVLRRQLPLIVTGAVFLLLFATASVLYRGFFSTRVVGNLIGDNAVVGLCALGMTFVILAGCIDLSVGSVVALSSVLVATGIDRWGLHPAVAMGLVVMAGGLWGVGQGLLVERFQVPAFLVTLGGMFLARGLAFWVSAESIGITHPFLARLAGWRISLGGRGAISMTGGVFILVVGIAAWILRFSVFGRSVYAVGGNPESARLMGLSVIRTRVGVFGMSGLCAGLAGATASVYAGSGNPSFGVGLELDAIAAAVMGGTLLRGGVGWAEGTFLGVLIAGTIQSALVFDGRLNSWWYRIAVGLLLLGFILLQSILSTRSRNAPGATLTRP